MDQIAQFFHNSFDLLAPYPMAEAFVIIAAFLVLAKLIDLLATKLVARVVEKTRNNLDDRLASILHQPIFATVALSGVLIASYDFDPAIREPTISIVGSILILVWVIFAWRLSSLMLEAMRKNLRRFDFVQPTTEPLLRNALAVLIFLAGAYAILLAWDINVTGLVASAGILGLALSFAAQDTLSNLFAGVAILTDRPYQIGDYIILDSGERGEVTQIGLRSTRLLTRDDVEVSIPNGVMGSAKIINEAGGPRLRYRIRVAVGVAYGSDIDQVMEALMSAAQEHEKVLKAPEARVRFRAFGESSLDFEMLCWIARPADRGLVTHDLHCAIYRRFNADGITIPFPQRDLHIKQMPTES